MFREIGPDDGKLPIVTLSTEVPLKDIYVGVDFPPPRSPADLQQKIDTLRLQDF